MTRSKKPTIKEENFKLNPLINLGFEILLTNLTDNQAFVTDNEGIHLPKQYLVERDSRINVYTKSEYRLFIMSLPVNSRLLLLWLMYEIEPGKDYLWINKERYMQESNLTSINTYKSAVLELVNNCVLALSPIKDVYWINPRLFFNGNRANKYPNHVKIYNKIKKDLNV
jgi:hypothetical protein